jgi:hypothetical protein
MPALHLRKRAGVHWMVHKSCLSTSQYKSLMHARTHTHIYIRGVSEIGSHILDSLAVDQNITKELHMNTHPRTLRFFIMITLGNSGLQNLYFAACYNSG